MRKAACLLLAVLAAGCGPKDADPGPGGVTVAEANALDQAAEMLEQRRLPPEATQATAPVSGASASASASTSPPPTPAR